MLMAALSVLLGAVTVVVHMRREERMHAYAARAVNIKYLECLSTCL